MRQRPDFGNICVRQKLRFGNVLLEATRSCRPARMIVAVHVGLTLIERLEALSCLTLDTPHSFWVTGDGVRQSDSLKTDPRYSYWLGFGDSECTDLALEGPVPSCLKHDVAYSTLQSLVGTGDTSELAETWNARNKGLADRKFKADILKYGCQDSNAGGSVF